MNKNNRNIPLFLMALGATDFLGVNYYTSRLTTRTDRPYDPPHYDDDMDIKREVDPSWTE